MVSFHRICNQSVLALGLLLLALPALAAFTAAVDRSQLSINESLTLTLSYSGQTMASPDLKALTKDFDILSQQQNSQLAFGFGNDSSSTEWVLALGPKRTGTLTIPPISFQGETSQAIAVTVSEADKQPSASGEALFVTAELDRTEAPVQSQVLLTLRLHTAVTLGSVDIPEVQLAGATVLKIHDSQYQKTIAGRDYLVLEIRYALFAEAPGELTIPPLTIAGVVPSANDPFGGSGFFGPRGKAVRLRSDELKLQVLPIPDQANGHPWLPAKGLSLSQSWSRKPDQLRVGEPVTRTVTLTAQGLTGAQIPPLTAPESEDFKQYPDQPEISETLSADGVLGVRSESVALVPTRPGTITLPAQTIHWWDTANNRLETTQLEAVTLEVLPVEDGDASAPEPAVGEDEAAGAPEPTAGEDEAAGEEEQIADQGLPARWFKISLILNALLLVALAVALRHPRPRKLVRSNDSALPAAPTDEAEAFNHLLATADSDLPRLRAKLLAWAAHHWPEQRVTTVADLIRLCDDSELAKLFTQMDKTLYGSQRDEPVSGSAIKAAAKAIRKRRNGKHAPPPALKPLYPQ